MKEKTTLNKTRNTSNRFHLVNEGMGNGGDPPYYPTYHLSIANGVDRGNGYQDYMSITYALKNLLGFQ